MVLKMISPPRTMKESAEALTAWKLIPHAVKSMYRMRFNYEEAQISIHEPAFINIVKPEVIEHSCTCEIKNDKVSVSVWTEVLNMHVTVYW